MFTAVFALFAASGGCDSKNSGKPSERADIPSILEEAPVIPALEEDVLNNVRSIKKLGAKNGVRENVFAKVGDSITAYPQFLYDIGNSKENLGGYESLSGVIARFRSASIDGLNPFNRVSLTAGRGWRTGEALKPGGCSSCPSDMAPLEAELRETRASLAYVMFGTNDIGDRDIERFRANMTAIADMCVSMGVVPILSTIPDRLDNDDDGALVPVYNEVIAKLADEKDIPLVNYWKAMRDLPNRGLGADGIHPSTSPRGAADFSADGISYGFNVRNLTFLQTLAALEKALAS